MNKRSLFIIVIVLQLFFLMGMIFFHRARIASATRILLETVPVDPFSVFRGRYIDLNYKISTIPKSLLKDCKAGELKYPDQVYVVLQRKDKFWESVAATCERPKNKDWIFLEGKVSYSSSENVTVRYGMESFFLSETSADEIEANRRGWDRADWQTQQRLIEGRLKGLSEDAYRIYKAGINERWFNVLNGELDVWLKEGRVAPEQASLLREKYKTALQRIHAAQNPEQEIILTVEVAVTPDGQGYPVKLFWQGKEYR